MAIFILLPISLNDHQKRILGPTMSSIPEYMTAKHRQCDDFFSQAESAVAKQDWPLALAKWNLFSQEFAEHLSQEEDTLFPHFEHATGMTSGPTQMMCMEHQQMRSLVEDLDKALKTKNKIAYLGLSETLMVTMQQHNMKEEMMLYPMMEQHLSQGAQLVAEFKTKSN